MQDDPLMTPQEVANALGVCVETIRRNIRDGALAAVRLGRGGKVLRVLASDLRTFIAARRGHAASHSC